MESAKRPRWESGRSWLAVALSLVAILVSYLGYRHTLDRDKVNQHVRVMEGLEDARDLLSGREGASIIQRFSEDPTDLELAHRKIERARSLEPDNPEVHLHDGMYREAIGDWEEGKAACQKAQELREERYWAPAIVCLGNILIEQGRLEEAESTLSQAIAELNGASAVLFANLCLVLSKQGDLAEAGKACAQAVATDPRSLAAQNNFGIVLLQQGNIEGAIERFETALEVAPDSPEILANLGVAQLYAGRDDQALQKFEDALELDPSNGFVREKLSGLYRERGNVLRAEVLEAGTPPQIEVQ